MGVQVWKWAISEPRTKARLCERSKRFGRSVGRYPLTPLAKPRFVRGSERHVCQTEALPGLVNWEFCSPTFLDSRPVKRHKLQNENWAANRHHSTGTSP